MHTVSYHRANPLKFQKLYKKHHVYCERHRRKPVTAQNFLYARQAHRRGVHCTKFTLPLFHHQNPSEPYIKHYCCGDPRSVRRTSQFLQEVQDHVRTTKFAVTTVLNVQLEKPVPLKWMAAQPLHQYTCSTPVASISNTVKETQAGSVSIDKAQCSAQQTG